MTKADGTMEQNIAKYKAFVTAVNAGSLSEAARILHYSQSGISRMIADLENECGAILLQRGKQGVCLTSSGVEMFPLAEQLCRQFDKLQMKIDDMNGIQSGVIRIGTFSSVATHWIPNIISEFENIRTSGKIAITLKDNDELINVEK